MGIKIFRSSRFVYNCKYNFQSQIYKYLQCFFSQTKSQHILFSSAGDYKTALTLFSFSFAALFFGNDGTDSWRHIIRFRGAFFQMRRRYTFRSCHLAHFCFAGCVCSLLCYTQLLVPADKHAN